MVDVVYTRFDIWNGSLNMVEVWYPYLSRMSVILKQPFLKSNCTYTILRYPLQR